MRASLIVAGGRSTRFGDADKAVAPLGEVPMIRRVAGRASEVVDLVVVNCRRDQRAPIAAALVGLDTEVSYRIDEDPGEGPMVGIATGLRELTAEYTFVVGCDMPFIDPGVIGALFERASGNDAAVPVFEGFPQPLHAVYRTRAMRVACEEARAEGRRRVAAALERLDRVTVSWTDLEDVGTSRTFENLNTREEFDAAEGFFGTANREADQHG